MDNINVEYQVTSLGPVKIIYRSYKDVKQAIKGAKQLKQTYEDESFKVIKVITITQDLYKL